MIAVYCGLGLLLTLQVPPPDQAAKPSADLHLEFQAIRTRETERLETLAIKLTQQGHTAAAKSVRAKIDPAPQTNGATRFVALAKVDSTTVKGLANVAANKPGDADAWNDELRTIQATAATACFELAERAVSSNPTHYALADACLRNVLSRLPNHPEARRLLGYIPHENGWATPFASRQLGKGMVEHPTFGWVHSSWVPHLENGELPAPPTRGQSKVRWLPAEEADQLHRPWKSGWKISTEHFQIQTNVPFSTAIAFGRQLEAFHDLFFALLADVIETDGRLPLARRFRDKKMVGEPSNTLPHQVYYFKNEQEYVDYLVPHEPDIKGSLGIYIPPKPGKGKRAPAYFFHDPEGEINATATLFHEVSHQLLFESAGRNGYNKNVGNYWVFEGLGTYFETVVMEADGVMTVGGLVGPRIEAARAMREAGQFVPIEQLLQFDQAAFNGRDSIHLHYAESMALALFLMQARGNVYREPFLDYAKDAYRGLLRGDTGRSLQDRLGVSYEDLSKEFLEFLKRG